jgi:hypothetical protein
MCVIRTMNSNNFWPIRNIKLKICSFHIIDSKDVLRLHTQSLLKFIWIRVTHCIRMTEISHEIKLRDEITVNTSNSCQEFSCAIQSDNMRSCIRTLIDFIFILPIEGVSLCFCFFPFFTFPLRIFPRL